MEKRIPKKTYRNIMNSLGGGTVPKEGLGYITVGRAQEIDSLLRDTEVIQDGGATFRFVVGDYGSGKTFLLRLMKKNAEKEGFSQHNDASGNEDQQRGDNAVSRENTTNADAADNQGILCKE